jgi:hypothetical protein
MLQKKLKAEWFRLYLFAMCCISFLNMLHSESIAISKKNKQKKPELSFRLSHTQ